jgi:hypothetical protein
MLASALAEEQISYSQSAGSGEERQNPSGQYVDKNNCKLRVRDGKEWERTGKPLKSLGGCNFRKGNYLRFCRESDSQCGGQEFDPPLLHQ